MGHGGDVPEMLPLQRNGDLPRVQRERPPGIAKRKAVHVLLPARQREVPELSRSRRVRRRGKTRRPSRCRELSVILGIWGQSPKSPKSRQSFSPVESGPRRQSADENRSAIT